MKEDLKTIEKAMKQIKELSGETDPKSLNQINRWINAKENHAQNIQNITSEYFLTQRIKENSKNYSESVILLHKVLVSLMKCKQTIDQKNVTNAKILIDSFTQLYLDKHGLKHLENMKNSDTKY